MAIKEIIVRDEDGSETIFRHVEEVDVAAPVAPVEAAPVEAAPVDETAPATPEAPAEPAA